MVGQNYRLTRDMKDADDALEFPLASAPLTLRQVYADAPGQAGVVWKLGAKGRDAAREIETVFREILPEACGKTRKIVPMQGRSKRRANA
jgi:chromosome partitioning protein